MEATAATPYDAVIMDCQMPQMDRYEATEADAGRLIDAIDAELDRVYPALRPEPAGTP